MGTEGVRPSIVSVPASAQGKSMGLPLFGEPAASPGGSPFPLAAKGFRPFFLLAGAFAVLILPLWLLSLAGVFHPEGYFNPTYWHAHEMVFGFAGAVIAGFLLTAAANWTSRETVVGVPLLLLALLWGAGRAALISASIWPRWLPAVTDLAFLPAVAVGIGRPIVSSRQWRQLPMIAVLTAMSVVNLTMHLDVLGVLPDWQRRGSLVAVDVVILIILMMAGRVFPMFTRNATGVQSIRAVPVLDALAIASMIAVTILQAGQWALPLTGVVAAIASFLCAARTVHWGARHSLRTPLVWILHAGYAWIPVGLALRAFAAFDGRVPPVLGTHALTVGAIGGVTLGMMSRVALGHTGRPLVPARSIVAAFVMITLAACVRVFVPLVAVSLYQESVYAAGVLFAGAFLLFSVVYFPIFLAPRIDGKPG